jgi:hypothetical protein
MSAPCRYDDYLKVSARMEMIISRIFKSPPPGHELAVTLRRHTGRECRYPDYRNVIITAIQGLGITGWVNKSLTLAK